MFYGGGGGGGPANSVNFTSSGGAGGGGAGKLDTGNSGTNGLGGGGGGAGIVVVRYYGSPKAIGGSVTSGSGSATGYTLHTYTSSTAENVLALTTPITATISGAMSGTGGFTWNSAGTLTLTGSNSYSGGTVISAGRVVGSVASLPGNVTNGLGGGGGGAGFSTTAQGGAGGSGVVFVRYFGAPAATGGTITSGSGSAAGYTIHQFSAVGSSTFTLTAPITTTLSGNLSGTGGFTFDSATTLVLTGSNSYSGGTAISSGTLRVGNGGSGGSLGTGDVTNNGSLVVNRTGSVVIPGSISGTGSLTKQAAGTLTLTGSNSYSGSTTIAAGTLQVGDGGTAGTLGGTGIVANAGTLSPGNSIASLATGTATFASGATFEYEVDSADLNTLGTAADLLVVNGDLDIASGTLLTFLDLATTPNLFVEDTTIFAMINYSGSWNGGLFAYGANVLSDGERFMAGTQLWEIDYNRTDATGLANFTGDYVGSNFVTVTAVPEPSTLVLIGIGLGGLLLARRRAPRKNSLSYRNIPI